jgi:toxin CptA
MPHSTRSSSASATCRPPIEAFGGGLGWRPSRWLVAAQALLGALGAVSVLISAVPGPWAWAGASAALGLGLVSARRYSRRRPRLLAWPADGTLPVLDGQALADARLHWRGPLAFLCWRDTGGRRQHLSWWPDTLPPAQRRELRLAAGAAPAAARARSVAG